jgi:hypothetical protein
MGVSLNNPLHYQEDPAFLDNIVTGDETWVHHITPETKQSSMMWKHPSSSTAKKKKILDDNIRLQSDGDCVLGHEGAPAC